MNSHKIYNYKQHWAAIGVSNIDSNNLCVFVSAVAPPTDNILPHPSGSRYVIKDLFTFECISKAALRMVVAQLNKMQIYPVKPYDNGPPNNPNNEFYIGLEEKNYHVLLEVLRAVVSGMCSKDKNLAPDFKYVHCSEATTSDETSFAGSSVGVLSLVVLDLGNKTRPFTVLTLGPGCVN